MKPVIRSTICIIAAILLNQCERKETISHISVPDKNFFYALEELGIDKDRDGLISLVEAKMVTHLSVDNKDIKDLKGIEEFVNLESLDCSGNQLTTVQISKNILLKFLICVAIV